MFFITESFDLDLFPLQTIESHYNGVFSDPYILFYFYFLYTIDLSIITPLIT
jgi:hypothetical protein